MKRTLPPTRPFAAGLLLAVSCCALAVGLATSSITSRSILFALLLAVPATIAARACAGAVRPTRLALGFVLAALVVLPPPLSIAVCAAALCAGAGHGVIGRAHGGLLEGSAVLAPVALASLMPAFLRAAGAKPIPLALLVAGCFVAIVASAAVLSRLAGPNADREDWRAARKRSRLEFLNVVAAWVFASLLLHGELWTYVAAAALVVAAARAARDAAAVQVELRASRESLSDRLTELATIHSISREIVSSVDLARVFGTLERECRKILDVDFFFIALVDRETRRLRVVYRRKGIEEPIRETVRPMGDSLASWVATAKRAILVDDFQKDAARLPFRPLVVDDGIRSALAVPLVIENEVTGVLSVQSRRPGAYDQHLLSVLYTIGQQAAVAIENARHFEMATVDSLTGLFLRDYFFRRLEEEHGRAVRYRAGFVLIMADLDGFKDINDRHGHLAGDRFLHEVGAAVRGALRAADLACRYGGDEFCLLLPQTDLAGARIIAERLRDAVSSLAIEHEGATLRATMSIGLAAFPDHESGDLKSLLRKSDQALYQAKRGGRDRVSPFAA